MNLDWTDLAFGSKKPLNDLNAIFIAAPRELSQARFKQIIKTYLPQANLILGLAKEPYVLGLEGQPQFKTLQLQAVEPIIAKVNATKPAHTITTLSYFQRDLKHILDKLKLQKVLLVNGSWYQMFHLKPEFYTLINRRIPYEMISPFTDEAEARTYAATRQTAPPELPTIPITETDMLALANQAAKNSFSSADFQTGVALGRQQGSGYRALLTAFNQVVPFQTYAWHYGSIRERNFSPMHDLNFYDTIHAEVDFITKALRQRLDLAGTTLFINLLPCPSCARMLTATDIAEFVYIHDHSDGYAAHLLQESGKTIRRLVQ